MIALLLAALLGTAHAHSGLVGTFRVHEVINGDQRVVFPDAMALEGKELVWGRWRWTFEKNELVLSSEAIYLEGETSAKKGPSTLQERVYSECATEMRVEVGWIGADLLLPSVLDGEARFGRHGRKASVDTQSCNVQLSGIQRLSPARNPTDAPTGAVTIGNQARGLWFVLVPDGEAPAIESLIE